MPSDLILDKLCFELWADNHPNLLCAIGQYLQINLEVAQ